MSTVKPKPGEEVPKPVKKQVDPRYTGPGKPIPGVKPVYENAECLEQDWWSYHRKDPVETREKETDASDYHEERKYKG